MIDHQTLIDAINIELQGMHGNELAAFYNKMFPKTPVEYMVASGGQFKRVEKNPYTPRNAD